MQQALRPLVYEFIGICNIETTNAHYKNVSILYAGPTFESSASSLPLNFNFPTQIHYFLIIHI
jgi:hypothetical protein